MADIHLHNLGAPYQIVYTDILNILPLQHPQNVKIQSVNLTPINAAISILIEVESHFHCGILNVWTTYRSVNFNILIIRDSSGPSKSCHLSHSARLG